MTHTSLRGLPALVLAAFVLMGQRGCGDSLAISSVKSIIKSNTAKITVLNSSAEPIYVVVYADDAHTSTNLGPNGGVSIETHVQGTYNVSARTGGESQPVPG